MATDPPPSSTLISSPHSFLTHALRTAQEVNRSVKGMQVAKGTEAPTPPPPGGPQPTLSINGFLPPSPRSQSQPPPYTNGVSSSSALSSSVPLPVASSPPVPAPRSSITPSTAPLNPTASSPLSPFASVPVPLSSASPFNPSLSPSAVVFGGYPFQQPFNPLMRSFPQAVYRGGQHFYQPRNTLPSLTPPVSFLPHPLPHPSPPSDDRLGSLVWQAELSIAKFTQPEFRLKLSQQVQALQQDCQQAQSKAEAGDTAAEATVQTRMAELREFINRMQTYIASQEQPRMQHSVPGAEVAAARPLNGHADESARKKAKRQRREEANGDSRDGRKASKKRHRREGETADERKQRKKNRKKWRKHKRAKRAEERRLREGGNAEMKDGEDAKQRKRSKEKKEGDTNGHLSDSAASSDSSASSASSSSADDRSPHSKKKSKPRPPAATNGHAGDDGKAPLVGIPLYAVSRSKKDKEHRRSLPAHAPLPSIAPLPARHLSGPGGPGSAGPALAFHVDDFAEAFAGLRQSLLPPMGGRAAVHRPKRRHWADPLPDDAPAVVERSTLLSSHVFHQSDIIAIMKAAMPVQTTVNMEAAALVTQAVCQFISLITAEAEDSIHPFDTDEPSTPLADTETKEPAHDQAADPTITSEKVLDALLRLGFDDYAVLSARHMQLYREQQRLDEAEAANPAPMDTEDPSAAPTPSSSSPPSAAASPRSRPRAWLPATLTASYLIANAQYVDMEKFSPSMPRHLITNGLKHPSTSTSAIAQSKAGPTSAPVSRTGSQASSPLSKLPSPHSRKGSSKASSKSSSKTPSSTPRVRKPRGPRPPRPPRGGPVDLQRSQAMKEGARRKKELLDAGLGEEDIRRIRKEERRLKTSEKLKARRRQAREEREGRVPGRKPPGPPQPMESEDDDEEEDDVVDDGDAEQPQQEDEEGVQSQSREDEAQPQLQTPSQADGEGSMEAVETTALASQQSQAAAEAGDG